MSDLALDQSSLEILQNTLMPYGYEAIVFGSRVNGTHQPFSDIDICLKFDAEIPLEELNDMRVALSESLLPYKVDLVDYRAIAASMQVIVDKEGVPLFSV